MELTLGIKKIRLLQKQSREQKRKKKGPRECERSECVCIEWKVDEVAPRNQLAEGRNQRRGLFLIMSGVTQKTGGCFAHISFVHGQEMKCVCEKCME